MSVTYLLNRLQPLPFKTPLMVTLNPARMPAARHCIGSYHYSHPVYDANAIMAQAMLPLIQGTHRIWYCGAWTGHGFHEDGVNSALTVARAFGVTAPWLREAMVA